MRKTPQLWPLQQNTSSMPYYTNMQKTLWDLTTLTNKSTYLSCWAKKHVSNGHYSAFLGLLVHMKTKFRAAFCNSYTALHDCMLNEITCITVHTTCTTSTHSTMDEQLAMCRFRNGSRVINHVPVLMQVCNDQQPLSTNVTREGMKTYACW